MPGYNYECPECIDNKTIYKRMDQVGRLEICEEHGKTMARIYEVPAIQGTRDGFGIGKEFVDERTGKTIDTWPKWEKAGYKDARDCKNMSKSMKDGIHRKIDKIKCDKKVSITVGGK